MPVQTHLEDFYVPSLLTHQRSVAKYSIQLALIMAIFIIIIIADASVLKEFVLKLAHLILDIIEHCIMLGSYIWEYLWLILEQFL
jgi:hypothetical protein